MKTPYRLGATRERRPPLGPRRDAPRHSQERLRDASRPPARRRRDRRVRAHGRLGARRDRPRVGRRRRCSRPRTSFPVSRRTAGGPSGTSSSRSGTARSTGCSARRAGSRTISRTLPAKAAAFLYVDSSARAWDFMADVSPGSPAPRRRPRRRSRTPRRAGRSSPCARRPSSRASAATRPLRRPRRRAGGAGGLRATHVRDVPHGLRRPAPRAPVPRPRLGPLGVARAHPLALDVRPRGRSRSLVAVHGNRGFSEKGNRGSRGGRGRAVPAETASSSPRSNDSARRPLPGTTSAARSAARSAEEIEPLVVAAMAAFRDLPGARDFARSNLLLGPSAETGCGTETLPGLRRALAGDGSPEVESRRLLRALAAPRRSCARPCGSRGASASGSRGSEGRAAPAAARSARPSRRRSLPPSGGAPPRRGPATRR